MQYLFACFLLLSGTFVWAKSPESITTEIRIPGPRSQLDISHDYHTKLLQIALQNAEQSSQITLTEVPFVSEMRVMAEMTKHNLVDIYWLGAEKSLSESLIPITVPTTKGLIGYRKFIIHQRNQTVFDEVDSLKQLQKLTACQGTYWPDTKILQNARLKVTTSTVYEDLFKMLDAARCDYFPRGYHDYTKEVQLRAEQYPQFQSYEPLLLHYPFAVFFYVAQSSPELAKKLQAGMAKLASEGAIVQHMQRHELTRHIFPLQQPEETRLIQVANPYLPEGLNTLDDTLWLQPSDFNASAELKSRRKKLVKLRPGISPQ